MDVFVSVGTGLTAEQEAFVSAVEARLKAVGFSPCTIGRNTFSTDTPLRAVVDLMDRSSGAVVIALERYWFENGTERRGAAKEQPLLDISLPTPWNQIEAAMAYSRHLPLLVLVDERLRCDGLLEKGNDWFVHQLPVDPSSLNSPAFTGLLESWRQRVADRKARPELPGDPAKMSVAALIGALGVAQLWALLVALAMLLTAAFTAGTIFEKYSHPRNSGAVSDKPEFRGNNS